MTNKNKKLILDLCGGTGAWSKPYKEAGYDVILVDPIHDTGEVQLLEYAEWEIYGILAAPPCTHLSSSGARWFKAKGVAALKDALSIVDACLRCVVIYQPVFWCLENPVGRLSRYLGKPEMYFNPCDYGDPYTKRTALWGNFNTPAKRPVKPIEGSKMHLYPPSKDRGRLRAITPAGFAQAFFEANR